MNRRGAFILGAFVATLTLLGLDAALAWRSSLGRPGRTVPVYRGRPTAAGPRLTTDHLTAKIAPKLQALAESHKDQIIHSAESRLVRLGIRMEWRGLIDRIPEATHHGVTYVREELGHWSIRDLLDWMESEAAKRPTEEPPPLLRDLRTQFSTR